VRRRDASYRPYAVRLNKSGVCSHTVRAHGPPVSRGDRRTSDDATKSPTLTRYNTTNMDPIQEALAAIESRDLGDNLVYQEYADFFGVD
jgi:hypothetical protein